MVTSLADSGPGTLRQAITTADAGATTDSYDITIEPSASGTIDLKSVLPDLSRNITLNRSWSEHLDRATGSRRFPLPHLYGR